MQLGITVIKIKRSSGLQREMGFLPPAANRFEVPVLDSWYFWELLYVEIGRIGIKNLYAQVQLSDIPIDTRETENVQISP